MFIIETCILVQTTYTWSSGILQPCPTPETRFALAKTNYDSARALLCPLCDRVRQQKHDQEADRQYHDQNGKLPAYLSSPLSLPVTD